MKLVHLVDFITKKFVTMHGHMNVKFLHSIVLLRRYAFRGSLNIYSYYLFIIFVVYIPSFFYIRVVHSNVPSIMFRHSMNPAM